MMRVRPLASSGTKTHTTVTLLACVALGLALGCMWKSSSATSKRQPGTAWVLAVTFTFKEESDLNYFLETWKDVIKDCHENEPFLLHYEIGRLESDPLKLHMLERYDRKDDYLEKHKIGVEFLKARPKLKVLQDEGKLSIEGYSYQELGRGFV
eukprot:297758_1